MKTIVLFVVIAIFTLGSVNAQEKKNVELGVNIGLSFSNVSDIDANESTSSKISYNIGASGEYYFSNRWGLKAKLIYDRKGWSDGFIYDEILDLFVENVDFKYDDKTGWILKDFNFEIKAGKTIALVGPSGVGKTTISHLIPRFYNIDGGVIKIDGTDINRVTLSSLRESFLHALSFFNRSNKFC